MPSPRRQVPRPRSAMVVGALLVGVSSARTVAAEPLPPARVSAVIGGKYGTGALADRIGGGLVWGFTAAYAPLRAPQTIGIGLTWSILWSDFLDGSARVADKLETVEFDAGLRLRLMVGARRRTVAYLGGGGVLTRSNEPIFDGDSRSYLGPWGGFGVETTGLGLVVTADARFAVLDSSRGTLAITLSVGLGK